MSCGAGHRYALDPVLLWLWCGPADTAPIWPLAWEPPYAMGVVLKRQKKKIWVEKSLMISNKSFYHKKQNETERKVHLYLHLNSIQCYNWPLLEDLQETKIFHFLESSQFISQSKCWWFYFILFLYFCLLGPHPQHIKVPRLGVESELQLPAYTTATAMPDPS